MEQETERTLEFKRRSQLFTELRRLKRHKPAMIRLGIIISILLIALFASVIAPHSFKELNLDRRLEAPSWEYPLGTDGKGRCVFSRIIYGSRIAILDGLVVVLIEAGIGITLGLFAGYFGGKLDTVISGSSLENQFKILSDLIQLSRSIKNSK